MSDRQAIIAEHQLDALNVRTVGGLTTAVVSRGGVRGEAQSYDGEASTIVKAIENLTEASKPKGESKAVDGTEGQPSGESSTDPGPAPEGTEANTQGTEVKGEDTADQDAPTPGSDAATGTAARGGRGGSR